MSNTTIGQILKSLIREKGLRQNYIAKLMGTSPSALSQRLSTDTDVVTTMEICQILGISIREVESRYFGKEKDAADSRQEDTASERTKLHK